ncbi:MAG TPA: NAD(P)-binding domain-containing protein [Micromonosporaceae bacterium]|nr:NAD(P)-binding domain-containing protein [Micromonosporaceae bacterium]
MADEPHAVVGVLGRGRMGTAVAEVLARRGQRVLVAGGRPGAAAAGAPDADAETDAVVERADLVALALPFHAAVDLALSGRLAAGRGRVLLDMTNPRLGTGPPARTACGAALLAGLLPRWRVVKALNTVPAVMVDRPVLDGRPVSVPVAGDDAAAKQEVMALVRRLGFAPLDAGGIERAAHLEALADLLVAISSLHRLGGRLGLHVAYQEAQVDARVDAPAGTVAAAPGGWAR